MQTVLSYFGILRRFGQKFGPYLMVEMLLPGGTLLALLLFFYHRRKPDIHRGIEGAILAVTRTLASALQPRVLIPVPAKATIRVSKSCSANRL
jgi:hypothetical protein